MHDLVVRGGTVVDGTGAPGRTADVAVDGGRVTEVGRAGAGRREIEADGARRLVQRSTGYLATVNAGEVTIDRGEDTGARPGALVRGAR